MIYKAITIALGLILACFIVWVAVLCYQKSSLAESLTQALTSVQNLKESNDSLTKTIAIQDSTLKLQSQTLSDNAKKAKQIEEDAKGKQIKINKELKNESCYTTKIPDSAVTSICVLQPSNPVCNKN